MAVDDLWFSSTKKGPDGKKLPTKRHGRGQRWRARWTDPATGKPKTQLFDRKTDAEVHDANLRADVSRGQYIDPKAGLTTFRQHAGRWQAGQVSKEATQARVRTNLAKHIVPHFGSRALVSIRPADVQALVRKLSDVLAPSTVGIVYRCVAAIFKAAVANRLIATTPCMNIKLPDRRTKRVEPLPVELVQALMRSVPDALRGFVWVGVAAGLRQGEILGLEVDRIDFFSKTIRVDQQLVFDNKIVFLAPVKSESSVRNVPMPEVLVDALAAHLAAHPVREVEVIDRTGRHEVTRTARLLLTNKRGRPYMRQSFNHRWATAVVAARAAVVADAAQRGASEKMAAIVSMARFAQTGTHDLRHFYASMLIADGVNVRTVQEQLGHANASETLDTYSHLWPNSDDRTRDAVQDVLGAVSRPVAEKVRKLSA